MIEFAQTVIITMAATENVVRRSSKEYKQKEAQRRNQMTPMDRHREDMAKFNKRRYNS